MKRGLTRWNDGDEDDTTSSSDDDNSSNPKSSPKANKKKKGGTLDFEALSRHGYKGGLSVLKVPPPKEPEQDRDWTWSDGKEKRLTKKDEEESFQERQKTRAALADGEQLLHVQTAKDKRNLSFQQKEKRKRDIGQTSRGKNYVEEEKRLLRDSGVYSGFDA